MTTDNTSAGLSLGRPLSLTAIKVLPGGGKELVDELESPGYIIPEIELVASDALEDWEPADKRELSQV